MLQDGTFVLQDLWSPQVFLFHYEIIMQLEVQLEKFPQFDF